jgi:outer membrane murein-binding lipoprotein Lpp
MTANLRVVSAMLCLLYVLTAHPLNAQAALQAMETGLGPRDIIIGLLGVVQVLAGINRRDEAAKFSALSQQVNETSSRLHKLERDVTGLEVHVGTGAGKGALYTVVDRVRSDVELLRDEIREDMKQLRDQLATSLANPGNIRHRRSGGEDV